jgi:translation initiation factor IF-2
LIATIVVVLPAVVLIGKGSNVATSRVAAAPPAPGQSGRGSLDPNFNQVPYPSQQSAFEDVYNPPAVAESPYLASPGASGVPGYGGGPIGPLPSPLPTPFPARRPGGQSFIALTGGGCPETSYASYFAAYLAGRPVFNVSGGWAEQGCTDRFWSMPMSGVADRDEPLTYVMWYFKTSPVNRGACGIWTYVPKGGNETDSAGDPSFYQVLRSRDDRRVIGSFSIKQAANRGIWAYGGTFNFDGGQIAIRLGNRGTGANGARHGAAQVLVNCAS